MKKNSFSFVEKEYQMRKKVGVKGIGGWDGRSFVGGGSQKKKCPVTAGNRKQ